jgi:hypothetical protein
MDAQSLCAPSRDPTDIQMSEHYIMGLSREIVIFCSALKYETFIVFTLLWIIFAVCIKTTHAGEIGFLLPVARVNPLNIWTDSDELNVRYCPPVIFAMYWI